MKYDKDSLYIIKDFLEEKLEELQNYDDTSLHSEEIEALIVEETMFECIIDLVESLIKE